MSGISSEWFKNVPEENKADFEALLRNSTQVLSALRTILQSREEALNTSLLSPSDFDTPNWAAKQAYKNGQLQSLAAIRQLIGFIN